MLKRIDENLINTLCLIITLLLLPHLLLEPQPLLKRIIQLRIRITKLLAAHEALEALTQAGTRSMVLGEGRHHLWVTNCRTVSNARTSKLSRDVPMKAGDMQRGSMYSPTSLSSNRALVRGSLQSTLC